MNKAKSGMSVINFNPEIETNITDWAGGYLLTFVDDLNCDNIY